jgi:exosortase E/protease (VPEID-CTERM system)
VLEEDGTGVLGPSPAALTHPRLPDSTESHHRWFVRSLALLLLLAAELTWLTLPFDATRTLSAGGFWFGLLAKAQDEVRPIFITSLAAMLFFSRPLIAEEFRKVAGILDGRNWLPWLLIHLMLASFLAAGTIFRGVFLPVSARATEACWLLWAALALGAFTSWSLALLPARFWFGSIGRGRLTLAGSVALACIAILLGDCSQSLWTSLQGSTFKLVVAMLKAAGQQQLIVKPHNFIIGTPAFSVHIGRLCSGLEGMGLICVFLAGYCWFYRRELRFPAALLLLPIGIAAVWLLNSVRITALILLGNANLAAGVKGFHSVAGWLFFNLTACGLIWASSNSGLFAKSGSATRVHRNATAAYLMPLIAIIAVSMLTRILNDGFDVFYPARVLATGIALWCYRDNLASFLRRPSPVAILAGVLVFGIWIVLAPDRSPGIPGLPPMPGFASVLWVTFRTIGSVVTVPIAEELAFRGFLLRKLVDSDFEQVSFRQFTWLSFFGSSILFGVLHGEWIAGIAAGMIFAVVMYRRGELADPIGAHMMSNALLSGYVLLSHNWSLWG